MQKGVSRGQPTPPDHHRGHAGRRAGAVVEALLVVASQPLPVEELRRRGRGRRLAVELTPWSSWASATPRRRAGSCSSTSPAAGRFARRPQRRMLARGCSRSRPRRACRKLHSRLSRSSPTSGRSPARDRTDPRRQRRRRRRRPRRARADRRGRARERVRRDPLSHDVSLRARLRARVARRAAARRRPRRRRGRDPRAPRSGRREAPGLRSCCLRTVVPGTGVPGTGLRIATPARCSG